MLEILNVTHQPQQFSDSKFKTVYKSIAVVIPMRLVLVLKPVLSGP
jgi:hypothetical protein